MKIVKPNAELMFAHNNDDLFALKHLESVGRTCYKSENNITDDSCINFVSGIIKRGHEAVIEHYSFIYELNDVSLDSLEFLIKSLSDNGFNSYLRITYDKRPVVSGNVRAWRELFKWATKLGYRIPVYMKSFVYAYPCNGVQREHNKKLNNGLPILHKVPPKRDYGRYFCIMAEKGGTSHGGLTEKLSLFFMPKNRR